MTFDLQPSNSIAIVGPSGAGKSTIANLLFRFWEYGSGEISLGGESLKSLYQDEVRKRCALVSQTSYFFNTSIRENLRLARPKVTQEEMESAAKSAQIHEFITGLPMKDMIHLLANRDCGSRASNSRGWRSRGHC